jgi:hypothetical protein
MSDPHTTPRFAIRPADDLTYGGRDRHNLA